MATAARKARKRSGEKFIKEAKVGTPIWERSVPTVVDKNGRSVGANVPHLSNKVMKRRAKQIEVLVEHDTDAGKKFTAFTEANKKAAK